MLVLRQGLPNKFTYTDSAGKTVTSSDILAYIKSLTIPPNYSNVKIYIAIKAGIPSAPPKQTYTGVDDKGRTQYGYSKAWKEKSKKTKFADLVEFGKVLPKIRMEVNTILKKGISSPPSIDMNIALIISIIMTCHFRLGNLKYKNMYKSYGITNIEVRHLKFKKNVADISFIGKKAVENNCTVDDVTTVQYLQLMTKGKNAKDPVFTYDNGSDCTEPVRANDINEWMKKFSMDITSKMFRTFATNVMLIELLREMEPPGSQTIAQRKRSLNIVLDDVSDLVHNTRAVCKKEYTHPGIVDMYINNPRRFKSSFMGPINPEPALLAYLRSSSAKK